MHPCSHTSGCAHDKRARGILRSLRRYRNTFPTAKAIAITGMPIDRNVRGYTPGNELREWICDIWAALGTCGENGKVVLGLRLGLPENAPGATFDAVGAEVGLSRGDAVLVYRFALTSFIQHLDRWNIPDSHTVRITADQVIAEARAAQERMDPQHIAAA